MYKYLCPSCGYRAYYGGKPFAMEGMPCPNCQEGELILVESEPKSIDDMSSEELGKVVARRTAYDASLEYEGGEDMGVGDRVLDGDGVEGTIVDVNDDLARVEWDNGDKSEMHMSRLKKASGWESD